MKANPFDQARDEVWTDIIYLRVRLFLWEQRHRRGSERWLTGYEIAKEFGELPPFASFCAAMKALALDGLIEGDDDGRLRHV